LSWWVWSGDPEWAVAGSQGIRTTKMGINGDLRRSPDVAFAGYRLSGIGGEIGVVGFEEYLQLKTQAEPA
jgi:aldehyde dehydrogenase (NAD+)